MALYDKYRARRTPRTKRWLRRRPYLPDWIDDMFDDDDIEIALCVCGEKE